MIISKNKFSDWIYNENTQRSSNNREHYRKNNPLINKYFTTSFYDT